MVEKMGLSVGHVDVKWFSVENSYY
jgi:hypothetical protein